MRVIFGLSLLFFIIAMAGVFGYNNFYAEKIVVRPPYFFQPGDVASHVNAVAFVFFFSLLAFGLSSVLALGIEGAKYGSLISTGAMSGFEVVYVVPAILACFAATELGQGVLDDYEGKGNLLKNAQMALVALAGALLSLGVMFFLTRYFAA